MLTYKTNRSKEAGASVPEKSIWFDLRRVQLLTPIFVIGIALLFALYTNHTWEDYYITYRVSKNFAIGEGLVFTPGEKVHVFTSPLNVTIPAFFSAITGNRSDEAALWLFRILSACLLGASGWLLVRAGRACTLGKLAVTSMVVLFATDAKIVDFTVNGQEIGFMMLFIALAIYTAVAEPRNSTIMFGLALAGLMYTRPDGFVYFAAIGLGCILFRGAGPSLKRSQVIKTLGLAILIGGGLYIPWLLWAWQYYGSPIPHTIIAKAAASNVSGRLGVEIFTKAMFFPLQILAGGTSVDTTLQPTNSYLGGWFYGVAAFSKMVSIVCTLYWCLPFATRQARMVSFALMLSHFYLSNIAAYVAAWYVPNCTIMTIFVFAHIVQDGVNLEAVLKPYFPVNAVNFGRFIKVGAVGVPLASAAILVCSAYQLRIQQQVVEEGNRKQVGLWLKQNASSSSDSVFLEPLGYIGYFSGLKMLDYPGLSSPEVVAAVKASENADYAELISTLHPDWIVLRPTEVQYVAQDNPALLREEYTIARVFDVSKEIASYKWLPGRDYVAYDQTFVVFRRSNRAE